MHLRLFQQSAFVLSTDAGRCVAFDLGHEVPSEVVAGLRTDAAVVTHTHPDHLHRQHLDVLRVPVFGPPDVIAELAGLDLPMTAIRSGDVISVAGITITAFDSDHGPNLSAEIDNIGLLAEADNRRVLFLGDMAIASEVPRGPWDLVLLPVGGGKVFTAEAAAAFLAGVGHLGRVVPIHFHGRADRSCGERFSAMAGEICDVRLMGVGETLVI